MSQKSETHLCPYPRDKLSCTQPFRPGKFYLRDQGRSHHTLKAFSADLNLLESYLPTDKQIGQIYNR